MASNRSPNYVKPERKIVRFFLTDRWASHLHPVRSLLGVAADVVRVSGHEVVALQRRERAWGFRTVVGIGAGGVAVSHNDDLP